MKFVYMDESGKNIMTQKKQSVFVFGGLIIDKENIPDVLNVFKSIYQETKLKVLNKVRYEFKDLPENEKSKRISDLAQSFEFHANKMFNRKDLIRNNKIIRENIWKYYPVEEIFRTIHELLIQVSPYINSIYMFKVDKENFLNYCEKNKLTANDDLVYEKMIDLIIDEYIKLLNNNDTTGAIIPDKLDSSIRDKFVKKINSNPQNCLWTEPIPVESTYNAFTQIIDIITYCYYKIYIKDTNMNNYKGVKKIYKKYLEFKVIERDLVKNHLELNVK